MKKKYIRAVVLLFFACFVGILLCCVQSNAATLKVKMKSKTARYQSFNVRLNEKTVTTSKTKGIVVNNVFMVSYSDIIKNKLGIKTTYTKKTGRLKFTANGKKVVLKLNSKIAYINGKKTNLKVAPVRAKFLKTNKTKIIVPIKLITKELLYKYQYKNKRVEVTTPFPVYVNRKINYYTGVKSNVNFNGQSFSLSESLYGINLNKTVFTPGRQLVRDVLGLTYKYDTKTKQIFIYDSELNQEINMTLGSTTAYYNGNSFTLPHAPIRIKRKDTNKSYICIPAASIIRKLGYSYRYSSAEKLIYIHSKTYFNWTAQKDTYDSAFSSGITNVKSTYDASTGDIVTQLTFDNTETISQVTATKVSSTNIEIALPKTAYLPKQTSYNKYHQIINQLSFVQGDSDSTLSIMGIEDLDYSYSVSDKTLTLRIMSKYKSAYSLKIMKPTNYDASNLTNNDYYYSKKFTITLPGDQTTYLSQNPIESNNSIVKKISYSTTSTGNTLVSVYTTKLQAYKIYDHASYITVNIDEPKNLYDKIVVLDAGHGGTDPGAVNGKTYEKNLNFLMMYTLMKKYFKGNAPEVKAYWTRTNDTLIPLADRAAYASKIGADIFVSLHMNAWTTSSVNGTEVYYSDSNNNKSFAGITSKKMGSIFLKNVTKVMNTSNRGVQAKKYTVVHRNTVPAILIELGFISGSSDYAKITNSVYQAKATKAIYDSILQTFNTYPTGR